MRTRFALIVAVILIVSCTETGVTEEKKDPATDAPSVTKRFNTREFEGLYMGEFGKATLMLQINYAQGKNASGFNILRGNRRNIKGSMENKGDRFFFVLEEPGNDKYDGRFEFEIDTTNFELTGKWIPNDPKAAQSREYQLKKIDQLEVSTDIVGEWHIEMWGMYGTAEFKKDGTMMINGSYYREDGDISESVNVNGTWIEENDEIKLELGKHNRIKKQTVILKRHKEEDMGDMIYLKDGDEVVFYPLGMYF